MLTPRENLLTTLRHELPEWIPIVGHCDPYNQPNKRNMDPALAEQLKDVRWHDESTINFSRYLGLDISDFYYAPLSCTYRQVTITHEQHEQRAVTCWHTPCGELRQVQHFSAETGMWYTAEHAVKEIADLPVLAAVFADMEFAIDPAGAEALAARRALVGDDGIVTFAMTGTPLGQMIREHAGVETVAYLWVDGRQQLQELFTVMEDCHARQFQLAASLTGVDAIIGMDDTSTTTQSPAMFAEFCLGYTDRIADIVHAGGKLYFHHSCGLIHDLLPLYRQTRMDAVHGYTVPPLGDVTIAEGKQLLGPRITIIPALIQLFGDMSDRTAVEESIRVMCEEVRPGDNVIFGLAPDPEHTMEETIFVAEACKRYRSRAFASSSAAAGSSH